MIGSIAIAGLQGLAHALGERLGKGKGDAVEIKSLAEDLRDVGEAQDRTEASVAELMKLFQQLVQDSDGLVLSRRRLRAKTSISFQPSESSPTLGDALLHLDANIRQLRDAGSNGAKQPAGPVRDTGTAAEGGSSILAGLDEEIQSRRTSDGSGRTA